MARKFQAQSTTQAKASLAKPALSEGFKIKLQIAATVFVPMLALGLWLNSQGFFS
jgi:hypothetical protein